MHNACQDMLQLLGTTDVAGTSKILALKIKYSLSIWSESCADLMGKYMVTCCWQGLCTLEMVV